MIIVGHKITFRFPGSTERSFCGWIRPKENCKPSESLIASLLDAWPPPILLRAKNPCQQVQFLGIFILYNP